ncbi:DNA/RNA non-specific endonuclease [Aspergillus mulundensis]|uniref:Endonuclease n=1 Tax=Aspergillus mulundensis TaxID=1810919 RepID=A0A3D8T588_9EURO|nr:hypothetical protein DSM5745_01006 [Aspergillus mulundensis]RDW93684.1 hypothetical protein DSM5745_01006 [Aspergillus mulundensis]
MSKAKPMTIAAVSSTLGAGLALLYSTPANEKESVNIPTPQSKSLPSPDEGLVILPNALTENNTTTAAIQEKTPPPVSPIGILKYGNPGPINDKITAISLHGAYDRRTRNPYWVAEHLTRDSVSSVIGRRKNNFRQDPSIPATFRARVSDYSKSGYDRGHQVPANSARWSQEAVDETFKMSNMCPQVGEGFNMHYWAYLEDFCRNLTSRYPSVRVITGPLYLPAKGEDGKWRVSYEVIGQQSAGSGSKDKDEEPLPNVAVPTHFYKIIFGEEENDDHRIGGQVAVGAFVLPNARIANDRDLGDFEVALDNVERASGLEFAQELKSSQRRRLCEEVKCDLKVKDFSDAVEDVTGLMAGAKI